jgi:hypothetical protein
LKFRKIFEPTRAALIGKFRILHNGEFSVNCRYVYVGHRSLSSDKTVIYIKLSWTLHAYIMWKDQIIPEFGRKARHFGRLKERWEEIIKLHFS